MSLDTRCIYRASASHTPLQKCQLITKPNVKRAKPTLGH